jgi:cation transport ATPase
MRKKSVVAINAAKYALGISASYILVPPVMYLIEGIEVSGGMMAERVIVGSFWFLIIFIALFAKGMRSNDDQNTEDAAAPKKSKKISNWNFVFIVVAPLALWSFFGQPIIEGTIENKYWVGVAFWVVVMFISGKNIFLALNKKTTS